jgi:hypothetical protein
MHKAGRYRPLKILHHRFSGGSEDAESSAPSVMRTQEDSLVPVRSPKIYRADLGGYFCRCKNRDTSNAQTILPARYLSAVT